MTTKISASADGTYGSLSVGASEAMRFGADNSGQLAGFRNKLINGDMRIAQRGTGIVVGAGQGYTLDQWAIANPVGNSSTTTHGVFSPGDIAKYGCYTSFTGGVAGSNIRNKIEGVNTLQGKKATLSLYVGATGFSTVNVFLRQTFGTGGSPSAAVDTPAQTINLTGTYAKNVLTFDVPSTAGKTLGTSGDCLELIFLLPAGTGAFFLTNVQLEEGSIATPFEQRPIGLELSLCQRYFQMLKTTTLIQAATTEAYGTFPFHTEMRVAPARTGSSISYVIYTVGTVSTLSNPVYQNVTTTEVNFGVTFAATGAIGRPGQYIADISLSAEL